VREEKRKKRAYDDDEDDSDAKDKYHGLKASSILELLSTKLASKAETVALEFLDMHATKVCSGKEWEKQSKARVLQIVQRKTLNIKEGDLFDAVVAWGKAECKRQSKDTSADNVRTILADVLQHIRFPCMAMDEVATKVTPSSILSGDQMLQVFTYLGSNEEKRKSMRMPWPTKQREPRRPPNFFTWDANLKHYSLQLSEKNMVLTSTDPNAWQMAGGSKELTKGKHEWEIVINQYDTANSYNVIIGVVPTYFTNWTYNSWLGSSTTAPGWGYVTGNGYKTTHNAGQTAYGAKANQGDTVKVKLDLESHTIEFFVNGRTLGVAFTDVYAPVRPAISMVRTQKCTLRFTR